MIQDPQIKLLPTWKGDIEEVCPGGRLAGVSVKVKQDGADYGEEDAPAVGEVGGRGRRSQLIVIVRGRRVRARETGGG